MRYVMCISRRCGHLKVSSCKWTSKLSSYIEAEIYGNDEELKSFGEREREKQRLKEVEREMKMRSDCELEFDIEDSPYKDEEEDEDDEEEDGDKFEVNGRRYKDDEDQEEEEEDGDGAYNSGSEFPFMSSWPKTYRQSIDMLANLNPGNFGSLDGTSLAPSSSSSSFYSIQHNADFDFVLTKPLILSSTVDEVPDHPIRHASQNLCHQSSKGQKCSSTLAVINGINVLCGVGLLSTPFAIKEGGWSGVSLPFIFGAISCYTGLLLMRCLDSSPGLQSYPDIGQSAFGQLGRLAIAIVLYVELYVAAVEYIILMSDNLSSLFPDVQFNVYGVHLTSHYFFAILTTLIVLPTVWLRDLSLLSYLSVGGVITSIVVSLCLLWVGVVDNIGFHPSGTLLDLTNMPLAIGLYSACYTGHSVFPNILISMENPSQFPKVLIICFTTCGILYTGVAICGYMMFGDAVQSQFTLNMPPQYVSSKIAVWTTVINPLTKYALTIYPVALSLEELLPSTSCFISTSIRTTLVLSTLVVALTVPYFDLVMSLIGSFSTMLVALIFPCVCYLKIFGHRLCRLEIGVNIVIVAIGVVCCCIGSTSTIMRIAHEMFSKSSN